MSDLAISDVRTLSYRNESLLKAPPQPNKAEPKTSTLNDVLWKDDGVLIQIARKIYQLLKPLFKDLLSPESMARKLVRFIEHFFLKDKPIYTKTRDQFMTFLKTHAPVEFALPTETENRNKLSKEHPFFRDFIQRSAANKLHRNTRNYFTYFQYLTHQIAYRFLNVGEKIPMPLDPVHNPNGTKDYVVNAVFRNDHGLVAYGLVPEAGEGHPLFLVQGTDKSNQGQLNADLKLEIGTEAFERNRKEIVAWFETHSKKECKAIVAGHSLGGAISQVITVELHQHIEQTIVFNAPAPGERIARKWEAIWERHYEHMKPASIFEERIVHFWARGDLIVESAGHWHLRGKMFRLIPECEKEKILETGEVGIPKTYANTPHSLPSLMFKAYELDQPYTYIPGRHKPSMLGEGAKFLRDLIVGFLHRLDAPERTTTT